MLLSNGKEGKELRSFSLKMLSVPRRAFELLRRTVDAARGADRWREVAHVQRTDNVMDELQRLARIEEVASEQRTRREREELASLLESNPQDARVKAHLALEAKERQMGETNQAALEMLAGIGGAGGGGGGGRTSIRSSASSASLQQQQKRSELQKSKRGAVAASAGGEQVRKISLKDMIFVLESDPAFRSQRILACLKAGYLGRGIEGEKRERLRE